MCAQIQRMTEDETATAVPRTDIDETPTAPARITEVARPGEVARPTEIGGPKGPEPTRYGDWEQNGRCTDF